MTARDVLAKVLRAGGRVIADPVRPRLAVPPRLKSLVLEHREALRALVLAPITPPPPPVRSGSYAHPWPDALAGLGGRTVGSFARCGECCAAWSWVRYGDRPFCLGCATRRALAGVA